MRRSGATPLIVVGCCAISCSPSHQTASIITRYAQAECIPPLAEGRIRPPTREWEHAVRLAGGATVTIRGFQAPSGRIEVQYSPNGHAEVAASAGDYVYPTDVRVDQASKRLYVKASGLAGGLTPETWLFEYDLSMHKQTERLKVDGGVLPPECPAAKRVAEPKVLPNKALKLTAHGGVRDRLWSAAA